MGRDYTQEEVIDALKTVKEEVGDRYLSIELYEEKRTQSMPHWKTVSRKVGGWIKAKKIADLETKMPSYDWGYVIECFEKAVDIYGERITQKQYIQAARENGWPSIKAILTKFDNFNAIKEFLGYEPNPIGHPKAERKSKEELKRDLKAQDRKTQFCKDCLEVGECDIELEDCEYYEYYLEELANK